MDAVKGAVLGTPWWVFALFLFVVTRGVRLSRPSRVALPRLLILPAIFVGLGLFGLLLQFAPTWGLGGTWVAALGVGTDPELLRDAGFGLAQAGVSGVVAGIFVGKMLTYFAKYRAAARACGPVVQNRAEAFRIVM